MLTRASKTSLKCFCYQFVPCPRVKLLTKVGTDAGFAHNVPTEGVGSITAFTVQINGTHSPAEAVPTRHHQEYLSEMLDTHHIFP